MQVEIDQSGKIEKTHRLTALGLASTEKTISHSLLISAAAKKQLQREFRQAGRPRAFVSRLFAAGIVLLLKETSGWTTVVIDTEYPGHEMVIRNQILELSSKVSLLIKKDQISFTQIGKKSPAHAVAYTAYTTQKADMKLSAQAIRSLLL